jgi:uncharacterized membrane protein
VDYGVLRAYQQSLFVLAPFITIGCIWVASLFGSRMALVGTSALALILLSSLVGLMPQETGGYPAQLTLDNSGQYYDLYYVSQQEVASALWLGVHTPRSAKISSDLFTVPILSNYLNRRFAGDIYPTLLLSRGSFVFLNYDEVRLGQETVTESGTFVTYHYPIGFLNKTRNLIYASPDDRVYH